MTLLRTAISMKDEVTNNSKYKLYRSIEDKSLVDYTASTRITPRVIIEDTLQSSGGTMLKDTLQTILSLYTGYYLTAVSLYQNVDNVAVVDTLRKFSTESDKLSSFSGDSEKYINGLPDYSLESDNKSISNQSNIVVGKSIVVEVGTGIKSVKVPINITLIPMYMKSKDILSIAKVGAIDKDYVSRYHQMRSGEISFFKDYLLALDVIEADRKGVLADKKGYIHKNRSKKYKSLIKRLMNKEEGSINEISTVMVITTQTAKLIEGAISGKLSNSSVRDKFFKETSLILIVILDTLMETVIVYHRGISETGAYTHSDIKSANKGNGNDIETILTAYKLGNSPTL